MGKRRIITAMLAGAIALPVAPQAQAAGFFDDLARAFMGRPAPQPYYDPFGAPERPRRAKPRPAVAKPPAEPAVKLDPANDAFWHLRDPTLRKGDIVVTRTGVTVYDGRGGSEHRPSDFTALGDTKRLNKADRQRLESAAASGRSYFGKAEPEATPIAAAGAKGTEAAQAQ